MDASTTIDNDKETRTQRLVRRLSKHALLKVTAERVTWFRDDGSVRSTDTRFEVVIAQLTESGTISSNNRSVTRDELRFAALALVDIAEHALPED